MNKFAVEYCWKFSELTAQIRRIGVFYNQTVHAISPYHSVKAAHVLLEKLEKLSIQIIEFQRKAVALAIDYRSKW